MGGGGVSPNVPNDTGVLLYPPIAYMNRDGMKTISPIKKKMPVNIHMLNKSLIVALEGLTFSYNTLTVALAGLGN